MREKGVPKVFGALSACLAVFLVCSAFSYLRTFLPETRALSLLDELKRTDGGRTRQKLLKILDDQKLSPELGSRVLGELIRPRLSMRDDYEPSNMIVAVVQHKDISFVNFTIELAIQVTINNKTNSQFGTQSHSSVGDYVILVSPGCTDSVVTGLNGIGSVNHVKLHLTYKCRSDVSNKTVYRCAFDLSKVIRVVRPNDIIRVPLTSDDALGARLRGCFEVSRSAFSARAAKGSRSLAFFPPNIPEPDSKASARITIRPPIQLKYTGVPIDVAFRGKFVDSSGNEYVSSVFQLVAKAGSSGTVSFDDLTDVITRLQSGSYSGELVLFTDQRVGYADPRLTNIWNGVLRFPVKFDVQTRDPRSESDGEKRRSSINAT